MKNLFIAMILTGFAIAVFADEPSFDCSKATTAVELKICNNDYLSDLDGLLAYNYKNASWSEWDENGKKAFKSEQKAWMVKRNACSDENCLADAYKSRIDEICSMPAASGVNDCQAWEKLGLDVDVASQAKVPDQQSSAPASQPAQQQAAEPPYKLELTGRRVTNGNIDVDYVRVSLISTISSLEVKRMVVNENACYPTSATMPLDGKGKTLKMGQTVYIEYLIHCNVVKIDVVTDKGTWTHNN